MSLLLSGSPVLHAESSESNSYRLDYIRLTNDSDQKTSNSYQLLDSISDISAEGSSNSYLLHNLYADTTVTLPVCGNGLLEMGEQCDDPDFGGKTCADFGFNSGNLACVGCAIVTDACSNGGGGGGGGGGVQLCGNGLLEMGEQCDDGNNVNGDGCNQSCHLENEPQEDPIDPEPKEPELEKPDPQEPDPDELKPNEPDPDQPEDQPKEQPGDEPSENPESDSLLFEPPFNPDFQFPFPHTPQPPQSENTIPEITPADPVDSPTQEGENETFPSAPYPPTDEGEILVILDETIFVAAQVEPSQNYQFVIKDTSGQTLVEQAATSDRHGMLLAESVRVMDFGDYVVELYDKNQTLVEQWHLRLEDSDYRLHENLGLNLETNREMIYLGAFEAVQELAGKGKPFSEYHAFLQGPLSPFNAAPDTFYLKAKANERGDYAFKLPEDLQAGEYVLHVVQVYEDGKISRNLRYIFEIDSLSFNPFFGIVIILVLVSLISIPMKKNKRRSKKSKWLVLLLAFGFAQSSFAVDTTPPVFIYEGKLLDPGNNPIINNQSFRFSLWSSDDFVAGDVDGGGAINIAAPSYGGWQEVHTLTPNADGTFFVELGSITPLPDMDFGTHKHLMVEIKAAVDPDTSYELMDPSGDNGADTDDRQTLGSTPYTNNADFLDNAEIGTTAGDLATLGFGNVWDIDFIPGGTNADTFVLDDNNTVGPGGHIQLQFGNALAQTLSFDVTNDWFEFNNDVSFNQNQIKDVALDNLPAAPGAPVAGQIYHNTTDGNSYIWNGVVWEDITATGGGGSTLAVFNAEYEDAVVDSDGTDNKGTLISHFVDEGGADKYNYYEWLTTETTLQDVDVYVSFKLPENFNGFTLTPLSLLYRTNDGLIANNQIDAQLFDSTGAAVPLVGATDLANANWSTANITFGGGPTFTAGENITLKLTLSATNAGFARIADIVFNYNAS